MCFHVGLGDKSQTAHAHKHWLHLGYGGENLLQDGVRLGFLRPVGLDLQAHGTWSGNEPAKTRSKCDTVIRIRTETVWISVN